MKKTLLITMLIAMLGISASYGAQSLSFSSNSVTYTDNLAHAFSFDVSVTYSPYTSSGLSFWLESENAIAGFLSVTGVAYGTTFPDAINTSPNPAPFDTTTGASSGYMTEQRDLGSTCNPGPGCPAASSTYFVATLTLQLAANNLAPGSYKLEMTTTSPHASEVTSDGSTTFDDNALPSAASNMFTITIVPEPSTLALIGLTAVGGAFIAHRRRRSLRD
jgi:hypothetical protein